MNLHPLNAGFVWQMPKPPYELVSPEQAQTYREQGGFILQDAFCEEELGNLIAALDPIEAAANEQLSALPADQPSIGRGNEIGLRAHAVVQSDVAKAVARQSSLAQLCHDLIGPQVRLYWDQLVYKRPGTKQEFPWHQDNGYTFVAPQQYLTCWVALNDATPDNGCPWIAPGLHL